MQQHSTTIFTQYVFSWVPSILSSLQSSCSSLRHEGCAFRAARLTTTPLGVCVSGLPKHACIEQLSSCRGSEPAIVRREALVTRKGRAYYDMILEVWPNSGIKTVMSSLNSRVPCLYPIIPMRASRVHIRTYLQGRGDCGDVPIKKLVT